MSSEVIAQSLSDPDAGQGGRQFSLSWAAVLPHIGVILAYLSLTVVFTWPMVLQANSAILGMGDARHHLWILWHTREALLGSDGLFYTHLLYYPTGISLLTHALGPLLGVVALPFWGFGPEFANNATVFIAFFLTGYGMYLLARSLKFSIPIAFFAGLVLLVAPIHLAGLYGHMTKVFIALIPLSLLAALKAVDGHKSRWWSMAVGVILLLALLHSAEQFVYAAFAIGVVLLVQMLSSSPSDRVVQLKRWLWIFFFVAVLCGPLLSAIYQTTNTGGVEVNRNLESLDNQPDVMAFLTPVDFGFISGFLADFAAIFHRFESYVFVPWVVLALSVLAGVKARRSARPWLFLAVLCIAFAVGPILRFMGNSSFTEYKLPVMMPYALLTSLPGLDFMRTPGRFMLAGYVALGIGAAFGLQTLVQNANQRTSVILPVILAGVLLLESWPQHTMPMEALPQASEFFRILGEDTDSYGVLDLPIKPEPLADFPYWHLYFSSYYQMFQMDHKKGIATGYLSRYYDVHPVFGYLISENSTLDTPLRTDITLDDAPGGIYANFEQELARNNYRYVFVHKPQPAIPEYGDGAAGLAAAEDLIEHVFAGRDPIYSDALVTVYAVETSATENLTPNILMFDPADTAAPNVDGRRWVLTPARFLVTSPVAQLAEFEIEPKSFHDPGEDEFYDSAQLSVTSGNSLIHSGAVVAAGDRVRIPVALIAGSQTITLTVTSDDEHGIPLNMTTEVANLDTIGYSYDCDIYVEGEASQCGDERLVEGRPVIAAYGTGWYGAETNGAVGWRWAASPAQLWILATADAKVWVDIRPVAVYDPSSTTGKGETGVLNVALNDVHIQQKSVAIGQPTMLELELAEGWNVVSLSLDSGNFRPADYDVASSDLRWLSFALSPIHIAYGR